MTEIIKKTVFWRALRKIRNILREQKRKYKLNTRKRQILGLIPAIEPLKGKDGVQRYIISLTSCGENLTDNAPYAIITLLNQTVKPDKIILWAAKEDKENIPRVMEKLTQKGLEIRFRDENTRLVTVVEDFPQDSVIFARDDIFYPRNYLEQFQHECRGDAPPYRIPAELENDFTMNGKIHVCYYYFDDRVSNPLKITQQTYERVFSTLNSKQFNYYGDDTWSFYDAFEDYTLKDKTVLIFGLASCNCEAMAVWRGAKKVYVVDYNKPICEHEKIEVLTHDELSKSGLKFDIGISFSSFEHDGLGRYGDPIAPDGDLKVMQYAKSLIVEDGLLFLGVPIGKDALVWNAHRIYGAIRLPMLIKGWLCQDVYHKNSRTGFNAPIGIISCQPLIVLKNVPDVKESDFIERLNHAKNLQKQDKNGTRDGALLESILEMQTTEYRTEN